MTESITVACPIVYGSIAFYLGKRAEEFNTHRWTLYVRGPQDEDLSIFIEKIAFTLHPSFENQVRVVTEPPFEITETGWGEFETGIRIYFKDPEEQPIDIFHQLRLYPPMAQQQLNVKKPVVAENYDEIIFHSPKPFFYNLLMMYGNANSNPPPKNINSSSNTAAPATDEGAMDVAVVGVNNATGKKSTAFPEYYTPFDDNLDCELLLSIKEHLENEIIDAKNRLINLEAEYVEYMNRKQQQEVTNVISPPLSNNNNGGNTNNSLNAIGNSPSASAFITDSNLVGQSTQSQSQHYSYSTNLNSTVGVGSGGASYRPGGGPPIIT